MSILFKTEEEIWREKYGYVPFPKDQEEEARQQVFRAIRAADHCYYVCGEADDLLFDRKAFMIAVDQCLNRGGSFSLVFYRHEDKDEALRQLNATDNTVLARLKEKWGDRFRLYHASVRPIHHFAVFGDQAYMQEEIHDGGKPRRTEFFLRWPEAAQKAKAVFKQKVREIESSEIKAGDFSGV